MKMEYKLILKAIGLEAERAKVKAWAVGGFARDRFIGKTTKDIDICVEGDTHSLIDFCVKKYGAEAKCFKAFGTARVNLACGLKLDFVRCRAELYPKPAALPKVRPSGLKDDLMRRDFTCNALALSIMPGEFLKEYDLFNSREAISKGYIEVLHDKSFVDDPTRLFRAVRFSARFGWPLGKNTERLFREAVREKRASLLSRQRIINEFVKILREKCSYKALKLADKYGLLDFVFGNLKYGSKIDTLSTFEEKLALLSLMQGERGADFVSSLLLPKEGTALCFEVLKWREAKAAPAKALSKKAVKILKLYKPAVEPFKLRPLLLKAEDALALGFKGGEIGSALKKLAKAQYRGKIKNKRAAVSFLKTLK